MKEKENHANTNVIINNWEYLDDFLSKYLDHLNHDKGKANVFEELFNNLFTVEEQKKSIPTLNIIREKLWLYYYKEKFKTNVITKNKRDNVITRSESDVVISS
jgi:hypothetical protein